MKAKYYQEETTVELHVLKENKDGTLDLGDADGRLIVGKCPQADEGQSVPSGHCVMIKEASKEPPKGGAKK